MTLTRSLQSLVVGAAVAALFAGCLDDDDALDDEEAALAGTPTTARPEIGRLITDASGAPCMATLIAPQVVVTTSRCATSLYRNTSEAPLAGAAFSFTDKNGQLRTYAIDRAHSFFANWAERILDDDFGTTLALAHLTTPVPSSQATPASLAVRLPSDGDRANVWGWDRYETLGKQVRDFLFARGPAPFVWDSVDDGGPAFTGYASGTGDLWGTVHHYVPHAGTSFLGFTSIPFYGKQIEDVMHTWDGPDEVGIDRPGMDYGSVITATVAACRAQCEGAAACKAFTWVASSARCYLKEGVPEMRGGVGVTSGLPTRFELGTDRPGLDLTSLTTARVDVCAAACGRTAACRAWTWVNATHRCWLKSAGTTKVASAGCTSGATTHLYEGDVNRPGFDYAVWTRDDGVACAATCAGDARCKAYTFDAFTRYCWLKDAVPWATHATAMTSGVRRGLEVDVNRSGSDYRSFSNPDLDPTVCQAACAREAQCQAWTYDGRTDRSPKCNLKSGVPAPSKMLGVVSGLKGLEMM
ncbi:MAG: hypothetical protein IPL61_25820 [Myxococcales bacterium]|nr:hypothetical protein [Myxococcales bacterium]